jgi:uncharacterized protein
VITRRVAIGWPVAALFLGPWAEAAEAKDKTASIVIRAGKADSPTHAFAVQFAEAIAVAVNGAYTLDVQESQGSVRNVIDTLKAQRNYLFTAGPNVVIDARRGRKPFKPDRRYARIRALFPVPAQTVHWVVRKDSGIASLEDLAGRSFITGGKGSVGERVTAEAFQALGIEHQVQIMNIDVNGAPAALKAKQVGGFAMAGAYPLAAIRALAKAVPIRLLGLAPRGIAKVVAADDSVAAETVPKDAYPGLDADVTTLSLPTGVYTTTRMSEAVAYAVTRAFWSRRATLITRNPPWQAANPAALATLSVRLHGGALRYYHEAHIPLPRALR